MIDILKDLHKVFIMYVYVQLLGPWHVSLIVVDATEEEFMESGVCISGELQRHNKTVVHQLWTMQIEEEDEPVAVLELPTSVVRPGVWAVQTPLGGTSTQ